MRIPLGQALDTLKIAMNTNQIFGVCMIDETTNIHNFYHIGTLARVDDFHTNTPQGLLNITAYGQECFKINAIDCQDNGIVYGECQTLPEWGSFNLNETQEILSTKLKQFYQSNKEINELHKNKQFNNLSWICLRWLEILPIPIAEKQALLSMPNCLDTCDFLLGMMHTKH